MDTAIQYLYSWPTKWYNSRTSVVKPFLKVKLKLQFHYKCNMNIRKVRTVAADFIAITLEST